MLTCEKMHGVFRDNGLNYFTGVPDSTFAPWMAYLSDRDDELIHRIAVNEGAAVAHAAGYHLATGELGVVYLQNAGLGNCVNPLTSLVDSEVYGIPMLLMVGWRGEPGQKDEPQHRKMGRVTLPVLDALEVPYRILTPETVEDTVRSSCALARRRQDAVAFIVRKGLFSAYMPTSAAPARLELSREDAVGIVVDQMTPESVVISTTGKTSRELFECREARHQPHDADFYTVGSMGYCTAIAMEVALQRADRTVYVLDGDGALLMHMGNTATVGYYAPRNLVHVVLDNNCHESTGGQPTVSSILDIAGMARGCGYVAASTCSSKHELVAALDSGERGPRMVVVRVRGGARSDLGRPTLTPVQTKQSFIEHLGSSG